MGDGKLWELHMEPNSNGAAPAKSGRDGRGRFLSGNNGGPGRPRGARNRLGEDFLADVCADWVEHGSSVLAEVREKSPGVYLRVVASLIPQHLAIEARDEFADMTSAELRQYLAVQARELGLLDNLPQNQDGE
jgi:hypothetical protein